VHRHSHPPTAPQWRRWVRQTIVARRLGQAPAPSATPQRHHCRGPSSSWRWVMALVPVVVRAPRWESHPRRQPAQLHRWGRSVGRRGRWPDTPLQRQCPPECPGWQGQPAKRDGGRGTGEGVECTGVSGHTAQVPAATTLRHERLPRSRHRCQLRASAQRAAHRLTVTGLGALDAGGSGT